MHWIISSHQKILSHHNWWPVHRIILTFWKLWSVAKFLKLIDRNRNNDILANSVLHTLISSSWVSFNSATEKFVCILMTAGAEEGWKSILVVVVKWSSHQKKLASPHYLTFCFPSDKWLKFWSRQQKLYKAQSGNY